MGSDRRSALGLLAAMPVAAAARPPGVARVRVGDMLPRSALVQPGAHRYLASTIRHGRPVMEAVWRREVEIEAGGGLRVRQRNERSGADAPVVQRDTLVDARTLRPHTHVRVTTAADRRDIEGFRFGQGAVTGLPDLRDNRRADYAAARDEPVFDLASQAELLQALPWRAGHAVSVPLFHPAPGSRPDRHVMWVAGQDTLAGPDGRATDCWVVACDYGTGGLPTRFWLEKAMQLLMRSEGRAPDGTIHRRTLIA